MSGRSVSAGIAVVALGVLGLAPSAAGQVTECAEPVFLECPANAATCSGSCLFETCATYTPLGPGGLQDLSVTFASRAVADPIVATPAEVEAVASDCCASLETGRGWLEYIDINGVRQRLDGPTYQAAARAALAAVRANPVQARRLARLQAAGHCRNWAPGDVAWYIQNAFPATAGGWKLSYECQEWEPGDGMSLVGMRDDTGGAWIASFRLFFQVRAQCGCMQAPAAGPNVPNRGAITMDLARQ